MIRQIIKIDDGLCNGCGLCVTACHEGAIGLVGGKAKLLRDDYCDGLGNCLPACPTGAISFEQREAAEFDEAAVKANMERGQPAGQSDEQSAEQPLKQQGGEACGCSGGESETAQPKSLGCGCPGTHSKTINRAARESAQPHSQPQQTHLNQWPVQIKLVPPNAPYFKDANLLIAADCSAYSYGGFHSEFMKNKITIIGCPKLDEGDYSDKLTAILKLNNIKSVTVTRMEVPCCGGIENAVKTALTNCGKMIPWRVVTISTDGRIIEDN